MKNRLIIYMITLVPLIFNIFCTSSVKESVISSDGLQESYYNFIDYDNYGFPMLHKPIKKKPVKSSEQYIIVLEKNGVPEMYVTVAIIGPDRKPSVRNIYNVIYKWTGKGFETGYRNSKGLMETYVPVGSTAYEPMIGAIISTPFIALGGAIYIACGTGGFVIGVADSIPATFKEMQKLGLKNYEMILSFTKLYYDDSGRMVKMSAYASSDEKSLLYETIYRYKGKNLKPFKTVSISNSEKKERIIYYSK